MCLTTGWTLVILIGRGLKGVRRGRAVRIGTYALAAAAVAVSASFVIDASSMEPPASNTSRTLGELVQPTVAALSKGSVLGGGHDGTYLVTWVDPVAFGSQGFGLVDELERHGFHVGALKSHRRALKPHRVLDPSDATAVVHLSTGSDIAAWRAKPGVTELAYVDPRTAAQRAHYERLKAHVIVELQRTGLTELRSLLDSSPLVVTADPRVPRKTRDRVGE